MQTLKSSNPIDLLNVAPTKKQTSSKSNNKEDSEFLSMILNAASNKANKGESINEKDIKEIVKTIDDKIKIQEETQVGEQNKILTDLANLDETTKNELYENANFMQLLQVLEILNGGEQISKFPNFSDKIAAFLSNSANVKELSEVKSITDLLDLAKKFDLGLENLTITNDDVETLSEMFKGLANKEFFKPVLPQAQNIYSGELKNQVEQTISMNESTEPVKLNALLHEISKEVKPNLKQQTQTSQTKTPTLQTSENMIDEAIETTNTEEVAIKTVQNLSVKNEKNINLQSLLYPEREQNLAQESMTQGEEIQIQDENPLNSMVRDISSAARSQIQEKALVKETFSNFSENLKEQIQNYKAPLTRVNITLNPMNLGEVEITMLNRGNNLHINFNSNTATMNLFLQNQAEFKNSLVNMGFTELEMNFNDQSQRQEKGQQAYKNQNKQAQESEEIQEAEQNLLELVIPRYV
ncbi:flagellar hook-length control protein FliK [Campylobacter sp. RM9344]|uniref:Flagellar hook-length control protein FliK n=1 Tax=Campylobacter californiensis TaxID=1032243 RepID=A0AAW3ZSJ8_9BACT|nr:MULTISPECIES: flagellar hook-length control protein FliK [unclassified Campylobacter]MBE2984994.1 flagellar hook-length control protein FliK [Campylobacter sp. RM6883]MBE2995190.1 flagellar hook-length control protein FliK [Campylobacter sp. RM6913]MBE3029554.1 flagellar hook-length control protein FliK [Campylobacter sp. RM9344]MBE3608182.1 flagellar hook-length control protein FliK [Campylobacter sp. RM9337]QCD51647.1 flagellar hook-length control protein [Campylobacter sp. RM6914]